MTSIGHTTAQHAFHIVKDGPWFVMQCRRRAARPSPRVALPPPHHEHSYHTECEGGGCTVDRLVIAHPEVHDGVFRELDVPNLRELKLYETRAVSWQGHTCLFSKCPLLQSVSVGDDVLSNVSIFTLATNCTCLEHLSLGDHCAERVTDFAIFSLARLCTRLHTLHIGTCEGISASALVHLVRQCPSLKTLRLHDERMYTRDLIQTKVEVVVVTRSVSH
jgi:hypothetical protein